MHAGVRVILFPGLRQTAMLYVKATMVLVITMADQPDCLLVLPGPNLSAGSRKQKWGQITTSGAGCCLNTVKSPAI